MSQNISSREPYQDKFYIKYKTKTQEEILGFRTSRDGAPLMEALLPDSPDTSLRSI